MPKILFIAHLPDLSGASQVLLDVIDSVDRSAFDIEAVCPGQGPLAQDLSARGIPLCLIENPGPSLGEARGPFSKIAVLRSRIAYATAVRRRIQAAKPDLVFINSMVNVYAGIAARAARARVVYHAHEVFPRTPANRAKAWLVERCADSIIAVSQAGAEVFSPRARAGKVRTIYNGVCLERFAFDAARRARMREKLGLSESHIAVGNIGFITPRKGIEFFLQAARLALPRADNCRFFVIGDGDPSCPDYYSSLLRYVAANNLEGRVRFLSFAQDIEAYCSALDILALTSVSESLPRVVLEAMAASVPVMATDVGGLRECIEDGISGIVVAPRRPDRIAAALMDLAQDPEKRNRLARSALEAVRRKFSMENFQRQFQAFFSEIFASSKSRRKDPA